MLTEFIHRCTAAIVLGYVLLAGQALAQEDSAAGASANGIGMGIAGGNNQYYLDSSANPSESMSLSFGFLTPGL